MKQRKKLPSSPEFLDAIAGQAIKAYGPDNTCGARGFRFDTKLKGGKKSTYKTLQVFVTEKLNEPTTPIPNLEVEWEGETYSFVPDVVAIGDGMATYGGPQIGSGVLCPGASLCAPINAGVPYFAATCLLAPSATSSYPTHLLTCGHTFLPQNGVLSPGQYPVYLSDQAQTPIGSLLMNLLDNWMHPGLSYGQDAAIVQLNETGMQLAFNSFDGFFISQMLTRNSAHAARCKIFRPTTGNHDTLFRSYVNPYQLITLHSGVRGWFSISGSIETVGQVTMNGDSGTPLMEDPPARQNGTRGIYGLASGYVNRDITMTYFEPVQDIIQTIASLTDLRLVVWPCFTLQS